jgi:hypothetical protein
MKKLKKECHDNREITSARKRVFENKIVPWGTGE